MSYGWSRSDRVIVGGSGLRRAAGLVLAAGVLCLSPGVLAQPGAARTVDVARYQEPTNAALVYWRTWEGLPAGVMDKVKEAYTSDASWKPDDTVRGSLREVEGVVAKAMKASAMPDCDWGVEYSDGVQALLPHLAKLRGTARLLLADARLQLADGKPDAAAERVAAAVRMGRQTRHDGTLISVLVGQAIVVSAVDELEVQAKSGKWSTQGKATVRDALLAFDPVDPFDYRGAIEGEQRLFLDNVSAGLQDPARREVIIDSVTQGDPEETRATRTLLLAMSAEQVQADVEKARGAYAQLLAALYTPDADATAARLSAQSKNGEFGVVGKLLLPAMDRVASSFRKGKADHARGLGLVR